MKKISYTIVLHVALQFFCDLSIFEKKPMVTNENCVQNFGQLLFLNCSFKLINSRSKNFNSNNKRTSL